MSKLADVTDDTEFGQRVEKILTGKGVTAEPGAIATAAARIVPPPRRNGTITYTSREEFSPTDVDAEATAVLQILLAFLLRQGAGGIRLPRCPNCRSERRLTKRAPDGQRVCLRCAERHRYGECARCLRMKKLVATTPAGGVCQRCSPEGLPRVECTRCHRLVTTAGTLNGQKVCLNCYPKKARTCVACGKTAKIAARILTGPHCFRCYNLVLNNAQPCPGCGQPKILAFLDAGSTPVCAVCAGLPSRFACRRCGSEEHRYARLCAVCTLTDRTQEHLADETGQLSPAMAMLRRYLLARPNPRVTLKWLDRGPHSPLLREIALGNVALTEGTFAAAHQDKPLAHLRAVLADSGALPLPAPNLTRLENWFRAFLTEIPAQHVALIVPYARWELLRKTRTRARAPDIAPGALKHARTSLLGIDHFLTWTDERAIPITEIRQSQVEEYLTTRSTRRWLPQFLTWFSRTRSPLDISLPLARQSAPLITLDETAQRALIDRVLRDRAIPLDARLAILLIAVFGQSAAHILASRRDRLLTDSTPARFTLHERPVALPDPIGRIATQLARAQQAAPESPWLFPGRTPGRHRDLQYLTRQLKPLGTSISALQNTARYQLASALPAKVLADMLGFDVSMFENYARLSNGVWGNYPALRAPAHQPEN